MRNSVKVATDERFCHFWEACSKNSKGPSELVRYASKKLGPHGTLTGLYSSKNGDLGYPKDEAKIGLEYSDTTLIFDVKRFFSKCSKKVSIGRTIMFRVCRRCLQNYDRMIHKVSSKYIQKS